MGRHTKPEYEVKKSLVPNGELKWFIIGRPNGKRIRAWFPSKEKAQAEATERNAKMRRLGEDSLKIDNALIVMATEGAKSLAPFGKSLRDAVEYYLTHLKDTAASVPFLTLAERVRTEFVRRLKENEVSKRHAESFENALRKLEVKFRSRTVSEISANEVRDWLTGLPLAAKTRNKVRGYARQIFGLALDYGYAKTNPLIGVKKFRERSSEENGEISILTSEETAKLFAAADPQVIPFLALHFFAGIRRATLEKIGWADVKMAEKRVIVPRYKGKNDRRYRVTLSDNLIEWLTPYVRESGSFLAPSRANQSRGNPSKQRTRNMVLAAAEKVGITLPDNVGRHTFISMHVAHFESIDKTALESDNSSEIIKKDYLDIVTREDAAKFWQIRP